MTARALGCLLAAALGICTHASAMNSFSNDASDIWWNENESGWGLNIIQQSNVLFATFFVYDATGEPHWFVASDMVAADVPTDRPYVFVGRLYETTGPVFSAASFDAATVTRRDVGSVSFEFTPPDSGSLTYTVDGTTVTKSVKRQTFGANNASGTFFGAQVTQQSPGAPAGCTPKTGLQVFDDITITQSGTSFSMTAALGAPPQELCRYTGTYSQAGHIGNVEGVYSCNGGANGSFSLRELEVGTNGFSANYFAVDRGCGVYGNFAGVRSN